MYCTNDKKLANRGLIHRRNEIMLNNYKSALILELSMIPQRRYIQTLFALAELENNEITWGQFNRKIQALAKSSTYKNSLKGDPEPQQTTLSKF